MEETEVAQDPSKQFGKVVTGNLSVINAATVEYLESARRHYVSELSKQEQTRNYANCDKSLVLDNLTLLHSGKKTSMLEQPTQSRLSEMGVQMQLPKGFLVASDKAFQSVMVQYSKTLTENTRAHEDELGVTGKEIGRENVADLEVMTVVPSDYCDAAESIFESVRESISIQKTVESLKTELQNLKREHAEVEFKDVTAEFGPENSQLRFSHCKPEREGCLAQESKSRNSYDEVSLHMIGVENVKGKGLKRKHNAFSEIQKRRRVALDVKVAKEPTMSAFDMRLDLPERMYAASVSTSESSARIMNSEDELESSSQKPDKSAKLGQGALRGTKDSFGLDNSDCVSEFSIRDYVFSARTKDICTNWPFSEKNLTLCLKHGLKNVLPPFQPVDSWRDGSVKRCSVAKSVPSEESNLNGKSTIIESHLLPNQSSGGYWNGELAEGYRNNDRLQCGREKELAFKMAARTNCQSEVESVSTSNLPSSEAVSDEREASASAVGKAKASSSQVSNTKGRVLKSRYNSCRGAPEEITSACTVPPDAIASKICPVCENFSSTSNTTLNAHIDQCLSSYSSPQWVSDSMLVKPRIKPRKMRSMDDIYATAPCCTLEDLDRRNGTNWASNKDFSLKGTEGGTEGPCQGVCSRDAICSRDDDSVYIDSSGRKIRILSKFNETLSSSFPKSGEDLKLKKQMEKGKKSQFIKASRKRQLSKHLKYLRVTCPKKRFLSSKVKDEFVEVSRAEEATCAVRETPAKKSATSFVKGINCYKLKNRSVVATSSVWMSSKMVNMPTEMDSESVTKVSRYDLRAVKDLRARSNHSITGRALGVKHTRFANKPPSMKHGLKSPMSDCACTEQKIPGFCCGRTLSSPPRDVVHRSREKKLGAAGSSGKNPMKFVQRTLGSRISPVSSAEDEVEVESESVCNADLGIRNVVLDFSLYPCEESNSYNTETGKLSQDLLNVHECRSDSKLNDLVDKSCYCSEDEMEEPCYDESREHFGSKQALGRQQHGSVDGYKFRDFTEEAKYDSVQSAKAGQDHKNLADPVLPNCLAVGETVHMNTSSDPQSKMVPYVSASCSDRMHCLDKSLDTEMRPNIYFSQHGLGDKNEMIYGDVPSVARLELKTVDAIVSIEHGCSFVEVDPIPIPGPPGSDLPSFSDMGSEDLHRCTSSNSGLEQSPGKGNDVIDGDLSDSLLSATSTISSLCVTDDPVVNKEECLRTTHLVNQSAYRGCSVAALSSVETPAVFQHSPSGPSEHLSPIAVNIKDGLTVHGSGAMSLCSDDQRCCCSCKEELPWTAAMNFQGSQLLGRRATSFVPFCTGQHSDSPLIKWPDMNDTKGCALSSFPVAKSEKSMHNPQTLHKNTTSIEEISPETASHAPTLRLMGKDLMVINNDEVDHSTAQTAQNSCMNERMHLFTEFKSGLEKSWERQPPQDPAFLGSLPCELDPHGFSVKQFDAALLNLATNSRSTYQASGKICVNKYIHSSCSIFEAPPLQR